VIVISKKEKEEIQNINLHNAKFAKIICDYDAGTVQMPIIMTGKYHYPALLTFENILHLECNLKEPWRSGIYIFEVNADDVEGDYFRVSIILNSGDEVNIIASKMIYSSIE
jgi:hypothetical protein